MPNNLFYNTGITTYIWLLSNCKAANRKGKVQLIDAGQLYRKLRKNLGNKNCEFAPEHIRQIVNTYEELLAIERTGDDGIAAKVFNNGDFGYYKVSIERPKRLNAQFTAERIEELRFDKTLREPMEWAYSEFGKDIYTDLTRHEKDIIDWCEKNELNLNAKQTKSLVSATIWQKGADLMVTAKQLMKAIGSNEYSDFNAFSAMVDNALKARKIKLSSAEKNAIMNAVSWYDAGAEKVEKGIVKLNGEKLQNLLQYLGCAEGQLADYGYYATEKKGEYLQYETESAMRDTENVPLAEDIHSYFLREVKPHVAEAWINLDATKIGYEVNFNKYFYRHKPLRTLEEVSANILQLEMESEGLIREILNLA